MNKEDKKEIVSNPLLNEYGTPFGAVPYDRITLEHFVPAVKECIKEENRIIHASFKLTLFVSNRSTGQQITQKTVKPNTKLTQILFSGRNQKKLLTKIALLNDSVGSGKISVPYNQEQLLSRWVETVFYTKGEQNQFAM